MRTRTLLATLVTLGLVLLGSAPAVAAESTIRDRAKDAQAAVDITRIASDWTASSFHSRVRVRDLRRTGVLRLGIKYGGEVVHLVVTKKAKRVTKKFGYIDYSGGGGIDFYSPCPDVTVKWRSDRNFIDVRFDAKDCLGGGRVAGSTGGTLKRGDARDLAGKLPYGDG